IYRLQRSVMKRHPQFLWFPIRAALALVLKFFTMVTHINLRPEAEIGAGMLIPHVGPIRISPFARIGVDCAIHHSCTIGVEVGSRPGGPEIADHVMIGCHTCILGSVHIGVGAIIGAGAVIVSDVPPHTIAVGVQPSRMVPIRPWLGRSNRLSMSAAAGSDVGDRAEIALEE
ncbi:MAG TPA: hypothetical protein VNT26_00840, partial [Candidatus Sulfotelmatobacter sp.]|nr:hypothetical protein [Candidatus Sulfotelmatobacter sp.]